MRCFISWLNDDGRVHGVAEWTGYFEAVPPAVGDKIVQYFQGDDIFDAIEVIERSVAFGHGQEQYWHLLVKSISVSQGGKDVARKAFNSFAEAEREQEAERARIEAVFAEANRKLRK